MAGEMWHLEKSRLGEAIKIGDPLLVKKLISKGENALLQDRKGNTYIHYVSTMHRPYVINVLLAAGVPINAQNKFGNTALHVTALHSECCHVPDLMQCGINPNIQNKDGKTAADLASKNPRWLDLHAKYEPTLRVAIETRDFEAMEYLFGCWSAVHLHVDIQNGRDMRQYAAGLTYHDIVAIIDRIRFTLMAVYSIKECNHKQLEYALSRGREICDVNFLHKVRGGHDHHMLQDAIRLKDYTMVDMLLDAGADLNTPVCVHEYIRGPLYFEVIQKGHNLDMELVRRIFSRDIDLSARDERGRSALVYCIDRRDGDVTMEMVDTLLDKGINIALRDNTGCTARDVALFARRHDIVAAIDQYVVDKIRDADVDTLRRLATHNYRDIFINYLNRDSWIYASGNETDDATECLRAIIEYWKQGEELHHLIICGDEDTLRRHIQTYTDTTMLLRYSDKGGRGSLLLSVLYNRPNIAEHLMSLDSDLAKYDRDNSSRGVWHYAYCLPEVDKKYYLELFGEVPCAVVDVHSCTPQKLAEQNLNFISEEQKTDYGMLREIHCMNKYEDMIDVITTNKSKLKHFNKILSTVRYPVAEFYKYFHPEGHPLVTGYRDLLHYAVDNKKEDIACKLVRCKVDCSVTEQYTTSEGDVVNMTAEQRASSLGLQELAQYIADKGVYTSANRTQKCDCTDHKITDVVHTSANSTQDCVATEYHQISLSPRSS